MSRLVRRGVAGRRIIAAPAPRPAPPREQHHRAQRPADCAVTVGFVYDRDGERLGDERQGAAQVLPDQLGRRSITAMLTVNGSRAHPAARRQARRSSSAVQHPDRPTYQAIWGLECEEPEVDGRGRSQHAPRSIRPASTRWRIAAKTSSKPEDVPAAGAIRPHEPDDPSANATPRLEHGLALVAQHRSRVLPAVHHQRAATNHDCDGQQPVDRRKRGLGRIAGQRVGLTIRFVMIRQLYRQSPAP